jgi:hypothetical protein
MTDSSADEPGVWGEAGTHYQVWTMLQKVFVSPDSIIICRLYKLTFSDQAQVTLQLR